MQTLILTVAIFLELLFYIVIADVILSWLTLLGIQFRPKIISDIIDPVYDFIRKIIPTKFGPFEFTPIVLLFAITFLQVVFQLYFPEAVQQFLHMKS